MNRILEATPGDWKNSISFSCMGSLAWLAGMIIVHSLWHLWGV